MMTKNHTRRPRASSSKSDGQVPIRTPIQSVGIAGSNGVQRRRKSYPPQARKLRSRAKNGVVLAAETDNNENDSSLKRYATLVSNGSAVAIPSDHDHLRQEMNDNDRKFATLVAAKEDPKEVVPGEAFFCHLRICILFDNDPSESQMVMIRAMLDTGSPNTLIFASELRKLKMRFHQQHGVKEFLSVTNERFNSIGTRQLFFRYQKMKQEHSVTAYVLEDPPDDQRPHFDILLGRDHLLQSRALVGDPQVIGPSFFVAYRPLDKRFSLR